MASTTAYKVPGKFFEDHMNRHWGEGVWADYDRDTERWSGPYVHVELTPDQASALMSDADFYADGGGGFTSGYAGLVSSAQATVRQLAKQGVAQ